MDAATLWQQTLPTVIQGVTGRGVWAALNAARPIALDNGTLVIGLPYEDTELAGHLKMAATQRIIEVTATQVAGTPIRARVIEGTTLEDLERVKRRDEERVRLQESQMAKMRAELQAKSSWETIYDQLARRYAAIQNKSLPQNKARFLDEGIEIVAEARKAMGSYDDLAERNFARCIERLAQYTDVNSTLVAVEILKRAGEM